MMAMVAAACSVSRRADVQPHAPPGWQSHCFPLDIHFMPGGDTIMAPNRDVFHAIIDMYRDARWFNLTVVAGEADRPEGLGRRRVRVVLRQLAQLGIGVDRVQIQFLPGRSDIERDTAYLTMMIPPEQVEALRIQRETTGLVVC
jgi:hypothetical protein